MKKIQLGLPEVDALTRCFWMAAMLLQPLLLPAHAQTPDAKPVTIDAARDSSTSPAGRNIYIAGGNVRPAAPVKGDLYAGGGRVIVEQPVAVFSALPSGCSVPSNKKRPANRAPP